LTDSHQREEVNQVEKECGQVKFTETDDGFRIEVTGKKLKDMLSCCCIPFVKGAQVKASECCPPTEEKK